MMIFALPDGRRLALCHLGGVARPADDGLPTDLRHFGFAVATAQELGLWRRRLAAHEIAFSEEDHGTQRSIYFSDPNGSTLEITTPPSESVADSGEDATAVVERWLARGE
jgi:catechol-2,3-dioxygenase